ncbi:MAG: hypothetical protein Salg2KO_00390 [Salibacteraceae bacterium]
MNSFFTALFITLCLSAFTQTKVIIYTTMGEIHLEMSDSLTPITSGNFIDLADSGYYDGVIFHRVINNFMIQGGDPTGTGSGGPGYTIPDEFDSTGTLSNIQKSISMANSGPNTGGSQFFINLVNNTYLDYDQAPFTSKHPVFGMVVDSFSNVQAIGAVPVNGQNRPLTDVVMDSVRIVDIFIDTTSADTMSNDTINDTVANGLSNIQRASIRTKIFPNPVGLNAAIVVESGKSQLCNVRIYDQCGRVVYRSEKALRRGMNRLDNTAQFLSSMGAGLYILELDGDGYTSRDRFIVAGQ